MVYFHQHCTCVDTLQVNLDINNINKPTDNNSTAIINDCLLLRLFMSKE